VRTRKPTSRTAVEPPVQTAPKLLVDAGWVDPARDAPGFREATGAALLIGRVLTFRGVGDDLIALWDRCTAALARHGELERDVAMIPAHDLSRFEEYAGLDGCFRIALGATIAIAYADQAPSLESAIGCDRVERAIARAAAIDFVELERRCAAVRGLSVRRESVRRESVPREWVRRDSVHRDGARALRHQTTRALLVPFGPIPSATLALGALAPGDALPERARRRIRGTDMDARPHRRAVHGEIVARAADWDLAYPELERLRARDGARPGDALHLIASYG
jgi:hypothetical protein